jgi:hypothetical protein
MARTSIAVLERELEYARKREAYLKRTDRPVKTTVDKRASVLVGYRSSLIEIGAGTALVKVQVSQPSLIFFGNEIALGLLESTGTNLDSAIPKPRGFTPAMIKATVGDATPTVRTAAGSGRRYVKYSANNAGGAQSAYSAPVCKDDPANTPEEQQTQAEAVATAIDGALGGEYGRVYFTPEKFTSSLK